MAAEGDGSLRRRDGAARALARARAVRQGHARLPLLQLPDARWTGRTQGLEVVARVDNLEAGLAVMLQDAARRRRDRVPVARAGVPRRRLDGARVLRHVRRPLRGPSRPAPHPAPEDWEGHPLLKSYAVDTPTAVPLDDPRRGKPRRPPMDLTIYDYGLHSPCRASRASTSKLNGEIGRKIRGDKYGKLEGYWSTEFGTLNQLVHLWSYADLGERERLRGGPRQGRGVDQGVHPEDPPDDAGPGEQDPLRGGADDAARGQRQRLRAALVPRARGQGSASGSRCFKDVLASATSSPAAWAYWQTEAGQLNEVVHMWVYTRPERPRGGPGQDGARKPSGRRSSARPCRCWPACSPSCLIPRAVLADALKYTIGHRIPKREKSSSWATGAASASP